MKRFTLLVFHMCILSLLFNIVHAQNSNIVSGIVQDNKGNKVVISAKKANKLSYSYSFLEATAPFPSNNITSIRQSVRELRWVHSRFATSQTVYFGIKRTDVGNGIRTTFLAKLEGHVDRYKFPDSLALLAGETYYWRVSSDNGSLGYDSGFVWSFRIEDKQEKNDITFFVSSDTHYGNADNDQLNKQTIDLMNATPGLSLPGEVGGGKVRTPRGVVFNGDLLDNGSGPNAEDSWEEFVHDYGLTGEDGRLVFPVYEGFGNHDGGPAKSYNRNQIKQRNKTRVGVTETSENGMHYSWDWDELHLVQLNLFGGDGPGDVMNVSGPNHDPALALSFLKSDLAKYVGKSNKKVIVFQHFPWVGGMSDWWTPAAKDRFYEVVKDYNIVALINGHSHGASFIPWKGLLTIHDGSTARPESGTGDFLVIRVTDDELIVIQRKQEGWGIMMRQPLKK